MDDAERYMRERARTLAEEEEKVREASDSPVADPPPPFRSSRLRRYRELLLHKAEALIERGSIEVQTNGEPLSAWVRTFPDGTAVLECLHRDAHGTSSGMTKLDTRRLEPDVIAKLLENAFLNARVRPVAGQAI